MNSIILQKKKTELFQQQFLNPNWNNSKHQKQKRKITDGFQFCCTHIIDALQQLAPSVGTVRTSGITTVDLHTLVFLVFSRRISTFEHILLSCAVRSFNCFNLWLSSISSQNNSVAADVHLNNSIILIFLEKIV